ncbi:MAG: DUF1343 domain-containing protein [Saprospiraceae bacterium]|nr:DUF1343 domain-containing protein [Saprospiraceae bacterium]
MLNNIIRSALFGLGMLLCAPATAQDPDTFVGPPDPVILPLHTGAEQLELYLPQLKDKKVGLVVNHTSRIGTTHLVDSLFNLKLYLSRIFVPEHGFRGDADAGEKIRDGLDPRTGTPIVSLYGKKKKPAPDDFTFVDVVVFDIQDVGARFYTYISTLYYVMEACAENGIPLIVLDRPNPNGHYVDGPVLDMRLESFVGVAPLPIVHGCTVGELARLMAGEYWFNKAQNLNLTVIPCENYSHNQRFDIKLKPSPNLTNPLAVQLYPSLCLFEGTSFSLGRGTDWPFQMFGHPDLMSGEFRFVPRANAASKYPPLDGKNCRGYDLRYMSIDSLRHTGKINLEWLLDAYRDFPDKGQFFLKNNFFDLLAGTRQLRFQIEDGCSEAEIRATWAYDLTQYQILRSKYLLYPE